MYKNINKELEKIYYDPTIGFSNLNDFIKKVEGKGLGYSQTDIKKWYKAQPVNQVFNDKKKKQFTTIQCPHTIAGGCLQADLMDISKYKSKNSNFKYLLNVVDVYSRYAWSIPLKSKGGKEISIGLEKVYKECNEKNEESPKTLTTDSGKEFLNSSVKAINDKYGIEKHYTINSKEQNHPTITAIVERFNKTLWNFIKKYTYSNDNYKFIDKMVPFLENYNNREHGTIEEKPIDVFNNKVKPNQKIKRAETMPIGTLVRIINKKKVFSKSMDTALSDQIYEIVEVIGTGHKLKNFQSNRVLKKEFQSRELKKIPKNTNQTDVKKIKEEKVQLEKINKIVRRNQRTKLDTDKDGNIVISKRLIPKNNKRNPTTLYFE